jgi:type VI secretion system protein VasD
MVRTKAGKMGSSDRHRAVLPWFLVVLASCSLHVPVTVERIPTVHVDVIGTPSMNRGESGEANATIVRLYELSDRTNFQSSTPATLQDDDEQALGPQLIRKQVLILQPGSEQNVQLDLHRDTRFLGVAADFISPYGDAWRHVHDTSSRRNRLRVELREDRLAVAQR